MLICFVLSSLNCFLAKENEKVNRMRSIVKFVSRTER